MSIVKTNGVIDETPLNRFLKTWGPALELSVDPAPFSTPQEIFSHRPSSFVRSFVLKGGVETSIRHIFGHVALTRDERKRHTEFAAYVAKQGIDIPEESRAFLGRVLLYNYRKHPDNFIQMSVNHLQTMAKTRKEIFPILDTEPFVQESLRSGAVYWSGRDSDLRPLLVVVMKKLAESTTGGGPSGFKRTILFCFEYASRFLYIPGIVETCSVVIDARGLPIHSFPFSTLSELTSTLSTDYPFRLENLWIISDVYFIHTCWAIFKQFLSEIQQQKLKFLKTDTVKELLKYYAPTQLEPSLGGTKSISRYYPFPLAPGPFTLGTKTANKNAIPNCHEAADMVTRFGVLYDCAEADKVPQLWVPNKMREIVKLANHSIELPTLLRDSLGEAEIYTLLTRRQVGRLASSKMIRSSISSSKMSFTKKTGWLSRSMGSSSSSLRYKKSITNPKTMTKTTDGDEIGMDENNNNNIISEIKNKDLTVSEDRTNEILVMNNNLQNNNNNTNGYVEDLRNENLMTSELADEKIKLQKIESDSSETTISFLKIKSKREGSSNSEETKKMTSVKNEINKKNDLDLESPLKIYNSNKKNNNFEITSKSSTEDTSPSDSSSSEEWIGTKLKLENEAVRKLDVIVANEDDYYYRPIVMTDEEQLHYRRAMGAFRRVRDSVSRGRGQRESLLVPLDYDVSDVSDLELINSKNQKQRQSRRSISSSPDVRIENEINQRGGSSRVRNETNSKERYLQVPKGQKTDLSHSGVRQLTLQDLNSTTTNNSWIPLRMTFCNNFITHPCICFPTEEISEVARE